MCVCVCVCVCVLKTNVGKIFLFVSHSQKLRAAGVVPGADMTAEAALTKLSYLLGKGVSKEQIKSQMAKNLRGELTFFCDDQQQFTLKHSEFLLTIAQALNLSSSKVGVYTNVTTCRCMQSYLLTVNHTHTHTHRK